MEKNQNAVLRGIPTLTLFADNLQDAKAWYSRFLKIEPCYLVPNAENPAYIEYHLGDLRMSWELLIKSFSHRRLVANSVFDKLIVLGAKEYEKITEREDGFITASVTILLVISSGSCIIHIIKVVDSIFK